ncbi:hypothetical protein [Clostridium oceanicum]|uniref:ABC-2 family transporter protein n=1 Tax=Clostridium oceanicum TaxID=1543 RepID=A0ABP3UL09_9CLOT
MERTLKVMTLDAKKSGFFKTIIINVLTLLSMFCLVYAIDKIYKFGANIDIPCMMITVIPYLLIINFSVSLGEEFTNKTDKIVFTGMFKRDEIIVSKLISFCIMSIVMFLLYDIIFIVFNVFIGKNLSEVLTFGNLFKNIYVFLIYSFTLGAFSLLVSSITEKGMFTGIVTYIMYFDVTLLVMSQALYSSKNQLLKTVISNCPFYIANTGFRIQRYTLNQSLIMIVSGIVFLGLTIFVINKKDM